MNPARLLYELLQDWQETPAGQNVLDYRGDNDQDADWLDAHIAAVHLLEQVYDHVNRLQAEHGVLLFTESGAYERLGHCIFATDVPMNQNSPQPRTHLSPSDLGSLQILSLTWTTFPPLTQATGEGLIELVTDARALVHGADGLDDATRQYLLDLISALEKAVYSVPENGDADVRILAAQLIGSLGAYLGEGDSPQAEQTKSVVKRGLGWLRQMTVDKAPAAFFGAIGSGLGQVAIEQMASGK